jgi:outer membrane protein assembly factor BamA
VACLAGVLVVFTSANLRADVGDYLGKPVSAVRLAIEGRPSTDLRLRQIVESQLGRPLSMLDVRESIVHLYSTGRFEDVRVSAEAAAGAVVLRYDLVPQHPVERIRLAGTAGVPGGD